MEANSAANKRSEGDNDRGAAAHPSDEVNPPTDGHPKPATSNLNDKERFEAFQFLAKSASTRFLERRKYEWQLAIALWTALGVSAAYLLTQDKTVPTGIVWSVYMLSGLVIVTYGVVWIPWIAGANDRDQATSYYWESAIENLTGAPLSENLQPRKGWPRHPTQNPPVKQGWLKRHWSRFVLAYCQSSQISQVGTTFIFWLVFIISLWPGHTSRETIRPSSKVTIENSASSKVTVDPITK